MKRSMAYKGVVVTLAALSAFVLLAALPGDAKEIASHGNIGQSTLIGKDNTLYTFPWANGTTIQAVGADGSPKWTYAIPEQWCISYNFIVHNESDSITGITFSMSDYGYLAADAGDGVLYVYLIPASSAKYGEYHTVGRLMAISGGRELWEIPLDSHTDYTTVNMLSMGRNAPASELTHYSDVSIDARGDRIYVFHNYNETVLDGDGAILWNAAGIAMPAAVDEAGFVYTVRSTGPLDDGFGFRVYQELTNTVDAYYPDGTRYWERSVGSDLVYQATTDDSLPLYNAGTIYAPMADGITAFDRDGNVKWTKTFDPGSFSSDLPAASGALGLYRLMPFDSKGNLYLQYASNGDLPVGTLASGFQMHLIILGPDGKELSRSEMPAYRYLAAKDGIGYATRYTIGDTIGRVYSPSDVTDLGPEQLYAVDLLTGKEAWNYAFTPDNVTIEAVDKSVAYPIFNYDSTGQLPGGNIPNTSPLSSYDNLDIIPGNGTVYVRYISVNYQNPNHFSRPERAYIDRVYAFDPSGTPLWYKPIPLNSKIWVMEGSTVRLKPDALPGVQNAAAPQNNTTRQNTTILYQAPDGRFGVVEIGAGVAGGLTITALLYLFLRFFCVGAVARAKARFSDNDNRRRIMDFIVKNPGSTLYEIARGTGLNLGTVKYHMFILGMNHKIVSSRMDGKYVRYFTNSGSYGREDQLVLSLMRRDTMRKVMELIFRKPGISNGEIARDLGIRESVASRCIKELADKGVVASGGADVRRSYYISDGYAGRVADAVRRLQ